MRATMVFALMFIALSDGVGQVWVFPETTHVYSDTFAIQVRADLTEGRKKREIQINAPFENFFHTVPVDDSIVLVPYYTLYDDERTLFVQLTPGIPQRGLEGIRFIPVPKHDSIELKIYRVAEHPTEQRLIDLAKAYEEVDCYGNALYIYWKLNRLGYRRHLKNFLIRNRSRCTRPPSVHR